MQRRPEPELMDDPAQAQAYADADFAEPNTLFIDSFAASFPGDRPRRVLDLGCGPADIPVRWARRYPESRITAVDGSGAMVELARRRVAAAGLSRRVEVVQWTLNRARKPPLNPSSFDAVISNSLLHQMTDPGLLWSTAAYLGRPGAAVFVMDLLRPESEDRARDIVATHAGDSPDILRRDFYASLCAAYVPGEVEEQILAAGLSGLSVRVVSNRHWIASGRLAAG